MSAARDLIEVRLKSRRAPYTRGGVRFASTRDAVVLKGDQLTDAQLEKLAADIAVSIQLFDADGAPVGLMLESGTVIGDADAMEAALAEAATAKAEADARAAAEAKAEADKKAAADKAAADAKTKADAAATAAAKKAAADAKAKSDAEAKAKAEADAKAKADADAAKAAAEKGGDA